MDGRKKGKQYRLRVETIELACASVNRNHIDVRYNIFMTTKERTLNLLST